MNQKQVSAGNIIFRSHTISLKLTLQLWLFCIKVLKQYLGDTSRRLNPKKNLIHNMTLTCLTCHCYIPYKPASYGHIRRDLSGLQKRTLLLLQVAVVFVYVVVIVVGLCGNSVVVKVVVRQQRLHPSINGFISCLVVSDIVLCTFSLPVQLHYQLTEYWVLPFVIAASLDA